MPDGPIPAAESLQPAPTLGELFHREEGPLLRFAFGLTRRRELAEEVVQEAFLRLHQHWSEVEQPKAWIYRCVRNLALNELRDGARETVGEPARDPVQPGPPPDEMLGRMEACGALRLLVAELEPADRELVELKYREHLGYAEIGRRTGLGVSNVGYRLHHILKQLADALRRSGIESPLG